MGEDAEFEVSQRKDDLDVPESAPAFQVRVRFTQDEDELVDGVTSIGVDEGHLHLGGDDGELLAAAPGHWVFALRVAPEPGEGEQ